MNICEYCDGRHLHSRHSRRCPDLATVSPTPVPIDTRPTRIEITGNIVVHIPIKEAS